MTGGRVHRLFCLVPPFVCRRFKLDRALKDRSGASAGRAVQMGGDLRHSTTAAWALCHASGHWRMGFQFWSVEQALLVCPGIKAYTHPTGLMSVNWKMESLWP